MKNKKIYILFCGLFLVALIILVYWIHLQKQPIFEPERLYSVTSVVDGDTFIIKKGKQSLTIRMLGINTPETVDRRKAKECFGEEASLETKKLLNGQRVKLSTSPNREIKDKYGRYLAYVYLEDNFFVNEYLVEYGYAREYTYGSAYSLQKKFKKKEKDAQRKNIGLWKVCFQK